MNQFRNLKANHRLIPKAVPEIIRYQNPLACIRRTVWEEILMRFESIEVVGEPVKIRSFFVKGDAELPVGVYPK